MKRYKTLLEAAGVREPIRGVRKARTSTRRIELSQTAGPYAMWMEPPRLSARINVDPARVLVRRLGITAKAATAIVQERRRKPFDSLQSLERIKGVPNAGGPWSRQLQRSRPQNARRIICRGGSF